VLIPNRQVMIPVYGRVVPVTCLALIVSCSGSPHPKSGERPSPTTSVAAAPAKPDSQGPNGGQQRSSGAECVALADLAAALRKLRDRKPVLSNDVRAIRTHGGVLVYSSQSARRAT
jgi:hypothetical protein